MNLFTSGLCSCRPVCHITASASSVDVSNSVIAAAENVYVILKGLSTSGDVMIAGRYPGGNLRASVGYDCSAIRPAHLVATLDCF